MQAINEYQLVKSDVTTYERLGYEVPSGGASVIKLYEWLAIDSEIKRAEADRDRK